MKVQSNTSYDRMQCPENFRNEGHGTTCPEAFEKYDSELFLPKRIKYYEQTDNWYCKGSIKKLLGNLRNQ